MTRFYRRHSSRRLFMKQAGAMALATSALRTRTASAFTSATGPDSAAPSPAMVKNRAPLAPNAFYVLPLGAVTPKGWLLDQLNIQASGLGGHLDETWDDVGPNSGWLGGTGESWERGPYFLDGLLPLAYLLKDERLKAKSQKFIDWSLASQTPDGMFGPKSNNDWWPRMVMLKALTQYQEVTGDPRVIPFLERYFAYQLQALPARPLRDWGKFRWQDNAMVVLWLYNRNGDPKLLELTRLLHKQGFDWQAEFASFKHTEAVTAQSIKLKEGDGLGDLALSTHGVNNGQALKASPLWSMVSSQESDRRAIFQQLNALDTYHGMPNGMFSCDEHFAGRNPSQGTELCTVVETMFSLEQSLAILGDAALGDRLEQITFNALPGTFTDDMWAHQYDQEPNQVECSLHRDPWTTDGPESNLYGLEPHFGCCAANFHQGWPKFVASLWMGSHDDGLVAAAYSPCEIDTIIKKTRVRVVEETNYPFRETVKITVSPEAPILFPLRLRIPQWAEGASIHVNGEAQSAPAHGAFAKIDRVWKACDVVELRLPMRPRIITGYRDSISIERGPVIFSYPIGESWLKLRDRGLTADWQVYPATQWNYALAAGDADAEVAEAEPSASASVFSAKGAPVKLTVKARKLPHWRSLNGVAELVPESPVDSSEPLETITLIPYAAAKLRITAFPQLKAQSSQS